MCFFDYLDPIFAKTGQKQFFFWRKITLMSKKTTGSVNIIQKQKFFCPIIHFYNGKSIFFYTNELSILVYKKFNF